MKPIVAARPSTCALTTLEWDAPRAVSVVVDRIDERGFGLRDRFGDVVQIIVGRQVDASFVTDDGSTVRYASDHAAGAELVLENVIRATVSLAGPPQEGLPPEVDVTTTGLPMLRSAPESDETIVIQTAVRTPSSLGVPVHDVDETILVETPPTDPPSIAVVIRDGSLERPLRVQAGLVVGRSPRVPAEQTSGATALVIVGAHGDRVSGSHLLVRNEAGIALARDLWSTNGTRVIPPYGDPYRLRGGDDCPLLPGSILDLGGDVTILIQGVPHGA